jgi:hypothetical protein
MHWILSNMKWIMILSGVLTGTMIQATISPGASFQKLFGETLSGPAAETVVRSWGFLIALMGAILVYGAFNPSSRPLVLAVAGTSKAAFIALVVTQGRQFLAYQAGIAVVVDSVMIALFVWYLVALRSGAEMPEQNLAKRAKA